MMWLEISRALDIPIGSDGGEFPEAINANRGSSVAAGEEGSLERGSSSKSF